MSQRLPVPGQDDGTWGDILNAYLEVSLSGTGTLNPNAVGTAQIQNNAVTNSQLDVPTQTTLASVAGKYTKPGSGIPASDLASSVQTNLTLASTALQTTQLGVANGIAQLDSGSKLISAQLPSAVVTGSATGPISGTSAGNFALRDIVSVKDVAFGAKGDGSTDDTAAIQAALTYAGSVQVGTRLSTVDGTTALPICLSVYIPDGTYLISSGLTKPQGVDLRLSHNATIRATSSISGGMLTTAASVLIQHETIEGGIWDCNGNADVGLDLKYTANLRLYNVAVWSPLVTGFLIGDSGAPNKSYGLRGRDLITWRPKGVTIPSGTTALYLRYATDCKIMGADLMGCATGVNNASNSNEFQFVHPWNYSGQGLVCFSDSGVDSSYVQCTADTPTTYGWQLQSGASSVRISNCKAILSSFTGTDNTAVAIRLEGTTQALDIYLFDTRGGDSSHRYASTFSGDTTFATWLGLNEANVVTTTDPNSFHGFSSKATLVLGNGTGTADVLEQRNNARSVTAAKLNSSAQFSANQFNQLLLATKTTTYGIATSDPKLVQVDTTSGAFTVTLPSASAVGAGAEIWIKDVGGALASNNLTLSRLGGDQFEDGTTSKTLATARGIWRYYSDGVSKWYAA